MALARVPDSMSTSSTYRDLLKHAAVYGVGQILAKFASFALLPLYAHRLTPADYGTLAILDLAVATLAITMGAGVSAAAQRYHFDAVDERGRDRVWWTALTLLAAQCGLFLCGLWLLRDWIAPTIFGDLEGSSRCFSYAVFSIAGGSAIDLADTYYRSQKWSTLSAGLGIVRLLVNVGLNIWLLVGRGMQIEGVLLGNFLTTVILGCIHLAIFFASRGRYGVDRGTVRRLWKFGATLIPISLAALVIHQADRFVLWAWVEKAELGWYSLAYSIGQAANSLFLIPFVAIWNAMIYEIHSRSDRDDAFSQVYMHFSDALMVLMLGVALSSRTLVRFMADASYAPAAELIPVICLAYVLFSLTNFYNVSAVLHKQMHRLIPVSVVAAGFNVLMNLLVVPAFGAVAAAWVSVATFFVFAALGWYVARGIDEIRYPLARTAFTITGLSAAYILYRLCAPREFSLTAELAWIASLSLAAAGVLFGPLVRAQIAQRYISTGLSARQKTNA